MADQKITQLTELAAQPDDADELAIVDDPAGTPVTKKITVVNLMAAVAKLWSGLATATPSSATNATFTAATNDVITSNGHGLVDGDSVSFTTTTTLPAGLSVDTMYYVINADTNTYKVSATFGGSAIDITDTGTGTHTWLYSGGWFVEFTAKKFLDIDIWIEGLSAGTTININFNGDIGAVYSYSRVLSGSNSSVSDSTAIGIHNVSVADERWINIKINNVATQEKFVNWQASSRDTGSGAAATVMNGSGTWEETSNQIISIQIVYSSAIVTTGVGSYIQVRGHD